MVQSRRYTVYLALSDFPLMEGNGWRVLARSGRRHHVERDVGVFGKVVAGEVAKMIYLQVGDIGDSWFLEEWSDQSRCLLEGGKLSVDLLLKLLCFVQRAACNSRALQVVPDKLVGFQFRCVAGKKIQRKCSAG